MDDPGIISSPLISRHPRTRDHRLDFLRGLCLIDMLLVHLAYEHVQFGKVVGGVIAYTRFAAGGFVFVSGLGIGAIFLPRALDSLRRRQTYLSLWQRAIFILSIQYISAMGLLLADALRGDLPASLGPWTALRQVLLLRQGGDLLPFYVMMVAASPILLELLRRRWGWSIAMSASAGLFCWGLGHPWAFALAEHQNFPPVLWQLFFVAGLVFGAAWPKYQALSRGTKLLGAGVAWGVWALLFISEYSSDFGLPHLNLGLSFVKVPLSAGEALRYVSLFLGLILLTDLQWHRLWNLRAAEFIQVLGRKSLPVYVAHLWVVQAADAAAVSWWWLGRWQILFAPISLALLWGFASVLAMKQSATGRRPWVWSGADLGHRQSMPGTAQ